MNKTLLSRAASAAALTLAAVAVHAAPVGLEILDSANNSVYSFGNLGTEWSTSRSVVFTEADGSVTSASAFKGGSASPAVNATGFSLEQISPLSKPGSFAGLTTIATASLGYGDSDGDETTTTDKTGYGAEARVALGGTLTAGQSVSISSATTIYGYLQTAPLAGQNVGDTVSIGVTGVQYPEPFYGQSDLLTADGVAGSLPGSFSASVSFSVYRVTAGGLEELYASGATDPFGLPVNGSISFQIGDELVFSTTAELSLTVSGAKTFSTDITLAPTLYFAPAVPEPGTLGLALLGLGGVALAARRRRG